MTTKELAAQLHGREYPLDLSKEEKLTAKEAGLVIVYGASDDLCELDGAISDEVGCNDGGRIQFGKNGVIYEPDHDEREVLEKFGVLEQVLKAPASFEAVWCPNELEASWIYKVPFPHETFDIMEDGELYCRGFVFKLTDALP